MIFILLPFSVFLSSLKEEVGSEGEDAKEDQVKITKKNSKEVFQNKEQVAYSEFKRPCEMQEEQKRRMIQMHS